MRSMQQSQSHYMGGMASSFWPGVGSIFYLDGVAGDNANNGLTPAAPKLTLTAALALCTNDADDYILALDYWQPAGETWPVVVNKSKVHIIGVRSGTRQRPWVAAQPPGDTAVLSIAASNVRVEGWYFDAGAAHGGIEFAGHVTSVGIFDCWFGQGANGILVESGGVAFGLEIANCFFSQSLTAQSIQINDDPAFSSIHDNWIDSCQGVGINIALNAAAIRIYNNMIGVGADVEGQGITLGANVRRAMVMNNSANHGDADMTQNPFLDSAPADSNHWANNWRGAAALAPA